MNKREHAWAVGAWWLAALAMVIFAPCARGQGVGELLVFGNNVGLNTGVPAGSDFVEVDTGPSWGVARRADGTLAVWGSGLDAGYAAPPGAFARVRADWRSGVGIRADGTVAVFGVPMMGTLTGAFADVSVGDGWIVGRRADGTFAVVSDGTRIYGETAVPPGTYRDLSASLGWGVGVRSDGSLAVWGLQGLADGVFPNIGQASAANLPAGNDFVRAWATSFGGVAQRADGSYVAWPPGHLLNNLPTEPVALQTGSWSATAWWIGADGQVRTTSNTFSPIPPGYYRDINVRFDGGVGILGTLVAGFDTGFTYQGRLDLAGAPANGAYDLRFTLWTNQTGGYPQSFASEHTGVAVDKGLFTVQIDFGANVFGLEERWLQTEVRGGPGAPWVLLSGRQRLSATPLAHYATNAGFAASATLSNFADAAALAESSERVRTLEGDIVARGMRNQNGTRPFLGVFNGGLAVSGASSPYPRNMSGVFLEYSAPVGGLVFAFDYFSFQPRPLLLNTPGGAVGIGTIDPQAALDVAGSIRCVSLVQTSTGLLKDEVRSLTGGDDALARLRPVSFVWNQDARESARGKRDIGLIAEEVARVLPEAVTLDEQGRALGVDYSRVAVLAVDALQRQRAQIDDLRARLERLERALEAARPAAGAADAGQ
jgi:hypothetical protein